MPHSKSPFAAAVLLSGAVSTCLLLSLPAGAKTFSYIDNGKVKLGVITDWGAGIAYFSRVSPARNLLNSADKGRECQQSYYGSPNGLSWSGTPWRWNPVQAGDANDYPSTIQQFTNDGTAIYARTIPKDWAASNVDIDGYMEEWITLQDDVAKIHFKFTYTGTTTHDNTGQELPALFVDYDLPNLVTYRGSSPWTNDTVTSVVPGQLSGTTAPTNFDVTEEWSAYVDGSDWGIGMYTPGGVMRRTSYRYAGASGPDGFGCSYVAPVGRHSFSPTTGPGQGPVFEYDVYLTIGTVTEIRSRFYSIRNGTSPPVDTAPPSTPSGLTAAAVSASEIDLAWSASSDDVGVAGYRIFRDGNQVASSASTSWRDSGLAASTAYSYTVAAYDAAGNVSARSAPASATTRTRDPCEWTYCAAEGEVCSFSGEKEVRYGAAGAYAFGTFVGGTACTNAVFGDPVSNVVKQCHTRDVTCSTQDAGKPLADSGVPPHDAGAAPDAAGPRPADSGTSPSDAGAPETGRLDATTAAADTGHAGDATPDGSAEQLGLSSCSCSATGAPGAHWCAALLLLASAARTRRRGACSTVSRAPVRAGAPESAPAAPTCTSIALPAPSLAARASARHRRPRSATPTTRSSATGAWRSSMGPRSR